MFTAGPQCCCMHWRDKMHYTIRGSVITSYKHKNNKLKFVSRYKAEFAYFGFPFCWNLVIYLRGRDRERAPPFTGLLPKFPPSQSWEPGSIPGLPCVWPVTWPSTSSQGAWAGTGSGGQPAAQAPGWDEVIPITRPNAHPFYWICSPCLQGKGHGQSLVPYFNVTQIQF